MEMYLTVEELAGYLKVAAQTVRRWVLHKEVPYHKIKRKVIRFRLSEIEQWVDGGRKGILTAEGSAAEVGVQGVEIPPLHDDDWGGSV